MTDRRLINNYDLNKRKYSRLLILKFSKRKSPFRLRKLPRRHDLFRTKSVWVSVLEVVLSEGQEGVTIYAQTGAAMAGSTPPPDDDKSSADAS